ncbi:MAG: HisS family protein, partial [Pseudomonadota bacterium]
VNNRKVLNGVMEVAGLSAEDKADERGIVLRAIDKLDRLGVDGVRALLGEGRKDESGDYTNGARLNLNQVNKVIQFLEARNFVLSEINVMQPIPTSSGSELQRKTTEAWQAHQSGEKAIAAGELCAGTPGHTVHSRILNRLKDIVEGSAVGLEGVSELHELFVYLESLGYEADRIVIDPSIVRGLGYYTGPVYEAELTFEIEDEKGRPRNFGSVAGGGRYDDLVKRFTGQEVPATGVSIGVDRLLAALHAKGRLDTQSAGPVVVTVMDRDRMSDYQAMVADLRNAGIRSEVYLGNPKNFGNQLRYADKRDSPAAVIAGSDEFDRNVVQIKDLILGAKIAETASLEEWKDRPSQFEVPRDQMVARLREILKK